MKIDVTFMGEIVIPLSLVVFVLKPKYLLFLLLVMSVFHAASVLNGLIGDFQFGVSPYYFVALCIAVKLFTSVLLRQQKLLRIDVSAKLLLRLLIIFWLWSALSSFLLPNIFQGLEIYSPRLGLDAQYGGGVPLKWTLSNLAQAIYLTLNVAVIVYALIVHQNYPIHLLIMGMKVAIVIVCMLGICQVLFSYAGLQFPYQILNSNIVYYQGYDQYMKFMRRLVCSFTEPSVAGAFLASVEVGLLSIFMQNSLQKGQKILLIVFLFLILDLLMRTIATTGYVSLMLGIILLLFCYSPLSKNRQLVKKWSIYITGVTIVFVIITITSSIFLVPVDMNVSEAIEGTYLTIIKQILTAFVKNTESDSFIHRIAADIHAIKVFVSTYGFGVGLGSNRSSSLIATLLSTIGLVGTSLFIAIVFWILVNLSKLRSQDICNFTFWSLLTLMIAQFIAIPDINFPPMWVFIILAINLLYHNKINDYQSKLKD